MKLNNKVSIITGGAKGIGFGCAEAFCKHGAIVVIADCDESVGKESVEKLRSSAKAAEFVHCDVTVEANLARTVHTVVSRFGRVDCLVNNAGWHPPSMTIDQTSVQDFEHLLRLNLTSTFMSCKFTVPHLRKTRGSIVNVSSEAGIIGQAAAPSYVATKAAQIGLTKALALDLASDGVRVNAVCPAGVMTPLMQQWANTQYDAKEALAMVDKWHPLGRMATIQEIGEICAFLASEEAAFVTGQAICPDGGASLGYRR
jgi:L-fucose dehydrogenase